MVTEPARRTPTTTPKPTDRIPPQDLDAEMALLGSMMMNRDAIGEVVPIIGRQDASWFYLPAHRRLFEVLVDMYDDPSKAIDLIVVSDELRRRNLLEEVGDESYMIQLAESFADWANAEYYARIVRDKGMLRDLIQCVGEIASDAYSAIDDARDILDRSEQRMFTVTERRISGKATALSESLKRLTKQIELKDGGICTGLPTGFPVLDQLTSGFQAGDLIVLAGRPSMGKTALGLAMAVHAAHEERRPVAFFSMEMSNDQVAQRVLCARAGIDSNLVRRRMVNDAQMHTLLQTCSEFEETPFYVDDTPGMTVMEVRSKARRLVQRHGIEALFIDYLQLMYTPKSESRQAEIAAISRGLKSLGRELGIPIIAMAQLNRMAEGRQDKRPIMSDLRESGAIEQDADVVLLIHREEYYRRDDESVRGKADLIIAKQRNGPTDTIELSFDSRITRFAPLSLAPEPVGYHNDGDVPF